MQILEHTMFLPFENSTPNLPVYQTRQSAGVDVEAWWKKNVEWEHRTILTGHFQTIPTGLMVRIDQGWEAQVRSRSGLAAKHGVFVLNAPGTIDADFSGEIKVILANMGPLPFEVRPGDRIAQIVFSPVGRAKCDYKDAIRGEGGFGSTGV